MAEEKSGAVDLLGDPWTEPADRRGRKRHRRTPQVAERVAVLRAAGLTVEQIAAQTFVSEPTLRKYYFRELEHGATLAQAHLVETMYAKAKAGVVGAARFVREEFEKGAAAVPVAQRPAPAAAAPAVEPEDEEPAEEKLGKKAAAARDAKTAHKGTGWGDLLN